MLRDVSATSISGRSLNSRALTYKHRYSRNLYLRQIPKNYAVEPIKQNILNVIKCENRQQPASATSSHQQWHAVWRAATRCDMFEVLVKSGASNSIFHGVQNKKTLDPSRESSSEGPIFSLANPKGPPWFWAWEHTSPWVLSLRAYVMTVGRQLADGRLFLQVTTFRLRKHFHTPHPGKIVILNIVLC